MKKRICLLYFFLLGLFGTLYAKPITITGVVKEADTNEPLIGASVNVKGTSMGTLTDFDGLFSLSVDSGQVLVFSFIGYEPLERKVMATEHLVIYLGEASERLDEIVVVGYTASPKVSLSASVGTATFRPAEKRKARSSKSSKSSKSSSDKYESDGFYEESSSATIYASTLTAGEVNDFAKWNQWENILTETFSTYLDVWKISPLNRVTAQLTNQQGIPVANAKVTLLSNSDEELWQTYTDNTGKAELWVNLYGQEEKVSMKNLKIIFEYQGEMVELDEVIPFEKGINTAQIEAECNSRSNVDLFFIVDATGSMSDEIRYLQVELDNIIQRVNKDQKQLDFRTGALVYRDHGDSYLTRKSSFSQGIQTTLDFLNNQSASGGGDYPEAVDEALFQAIEEENWDENSLARIAFLILDAPAHNNQSSLEQLYKQIRLAAEKGIRIVPVICSGMEKDGEYMTRCMALATNGTCLFLTDDSGVGGSHIKPTTDKLEVEKLNDAMVRIITQYTCMPDCDNRQWANKSLEKSVMDQFVPNPYDDGEDGKAGKTVVADLVKIYPNPCRDILLVKLKKEVEDMYFVDMTGKMLNCVPLKKKDDIEINVSNMATGVYFLKIYYKGQWFSEKLIVTS